MKSVDLCVIGAGISGLSLAAFASERLSVCVLEEKDTVGGLLQSQLLDNALFDEAANGWLDSEPAVEELIQLVNAVGDVTPANNNQATRYLVKNGLHPLSPKLLIGSTPLVNWWQKLRILREFIWSPKPKGEPSMADFMSSRFGSGIIDNFLAPMCAGIYADAPEKMSIRAAFPNLWNMANQGSILRQLIQRLRDKSRKRPHLTTMRQGSNQLCTAIADFLSSKDMPVQTGSPAIKIEKKDTDWVITTSNDTVHAKAIAITCPANASATLLAHTHPDVSSDLATIQYSPAAVVMQTFKKSDFKNPPIGFGALLSRSEQHRGLLGILFTSHLYPYRCSDETTMTRSILGGSIVPNVVSEPDAVLEAIALEAHRELFNSPNITPTSVRTIRWTNAIPRYSIGHWHLQERMRAFHNDHPTIRLSGNHLFGVAVKDCIRIGQEHANHFIHTLSPKI